VKFTLLLMIALLMIACDKNESEIIILSGDYFPLEIGNYWQFENSGKKEVIGTDTIDSKAYFILATNNDTSYYRKVNNKIYVTEYGEDEGLKFDLNANINDTWSYGTYTVKLVSKSDTMKINGHKITGCYQFFFDVPEWIDEEHTIWLAPGIGFIQNYCGLCYDQTTQLAKACIGGQLIKF
jgi:hypothetical protein